MTFTYPAPPATVGADLTTLEIHQLLRTPTMIRKRLADILNGKFIADFLLQGRFVAQGGAILYETGEEIFPSDSPEAVQPGGEYPLTPLTSGELAAARTVKWGQDTIITDESIARLNIDAVNRALAKLGNGNVKHVDSVALGVITSKVTQSLSVDASTGDVKTGAWATDDAIIEGVLGVKAAVDELNPALGINLDTIALKPTAFAKVAGKLLAGGLLPRESNNAVLSGTLPFQALGFTWVTSPYFTSSNPIMLDQAQLGGMADEDLRSPGYSKVDGLETKSIRLEETDGHRLRARRVTVPVVLEPKAAVKITATGV